jgi:hypothetical protein
LPVFMDLHDSLPEGVTAGDIAQAHAADLRIQDRYGVKNDKVLGRSQGRQVLRLVEGPSAEAANRVHREAHGLVADQLYEVQESS